MTALLLVAHVRAARAQAGSAHTETPSAPGITVQVQRHAVGAIGSIVQSAPQVLVRTADGPAKAKTVTLELHDSSNVFSLDSSTAITSASGAAEFRSLRLRSPARAYAQTLKLRLDVVVDGETIGDTVVTFTLLPPAKADIKINNAPARVALLTPFSLDATVMVAGSGIPIVGASAVLTTPDGQSFPATTGPDGTAYFANVAVTKGRPSNPWLRVSAGAFGGTASTQIMLDAGPMAYATFTKASDARITVGQPFQLVLEARDSVGNPLPMASNFMLDRSGGLLRRDSTAPDAADKSGPWTGRYFGPSGMLQITARDHSTMATTSLLVAPGRPTQLRVLEDVSGRFVADSFLEKPLVVQVQDTSGNGVAGQRVQIQLCRLSPTQTRDIATQRVREYIDRDCEKPDASDNPNKRLNPFIRGSQSRISDSTGLVRFDSIRIVGASGQYRLNVTSDECPCAAVSGTMEYNADEAYDRSFAVISAIKSIAGTAPSGEFFDIRFEFRVRPWLHVTVHSDIPLSRTSTTDTNVTSNQRDVVDAEGAFNISPFPAAVRDRLTDAPDRLTYVGAGMRIFNTVPYVEVHVGSVELAHSIFYGSSLSLGYAHVLDPTVVKVGDDIFRPAVSNLLIEGFLRSSGVDFFKFLNIRTSVMIPLNANGRRPTSRIVIAVPIGTLTKF